MPLRDHDQDQDELSQPLATGFASRRRRRERPVTYQLDLSQRRNSDELSTVKTPPRPRLERNPRSSPVVPTSRYTQTQGRSEPYASSAADGARSPQQFLPRLSFGRDISFNKDELDNLSGHTSPGKYARPGSRLRRTLKMSNSQDLRAESRRRGVSLTRLITNIAVIDRGPPRPQARRSSLEVTIGNLITGRKREYTVEDRTHEVHHVECTLDEVLSDQLLSRKGGSSQDDSEIEGMLYIYDVMNNDVLLSLPSFLDVLKQAQLPVLIVPSSDNGSTHESREIIAAVDEQCNLVQDDMTVYHTATMHSIRKIGYIPFLLQHVVKKPRDIYDDSSDSDPFMSDSPSNPLSILRSRNDSKLSSQSHLKGKRSSQHSSFADTQRSISENGYEGDSINDYPGRKPSKAGDSQSVPLTALVNRIVQTPMSTVDEKFTAIFFCVYKFFATPVELLDALLTSSTACLQHVTADEHASPRLIALLHFWILTYPGDFAEGPALETLRSFLSDFGPEDAFGPRRQQIAKALGTIERNDDTHWACCDKSDNTAARTDGISQSDVQRKSLPPASPTTSLQESFDKSLRLRKGDSLSEPSQDKEPSKRSTTNRNSRSKFSISLQRQTSTPSPSPSPATTPSLSKVHWRAFMELPEEILAHSVALIDRRLFLATKPRDYIRHVTTSAAKRSLYPSLCHISALTTHFNHLACWCASLILLRDKPRDRALTLEKCMRLARRIRELNDYHALGAMVAGIHNTAVHRLAQTRELLNKDTAKDFARLEILMSTARGHAAYRLAWENTTAPGRVPYVPVLMSDLVVADASGSTFAAQDTDVPPSTPLTPTSPTSRHAAAAAAADADASQRASRLINWPKFEKMGEVLYLIETTQAGIPRHLAAKAELIEDVRALLLDVSVLDDDGLYARSCAVEPGAGGTGGGGGAGGSMRKSFMDRLLAAPLTATNGNDGPGLNAMYLRG